MLVLALPCSLFVHAGSIDLILKILQSVFLEPQTSSLIVIMMTSLKVYDVLVLACEEPNE